MKLLKRTIDPLGLFNPGKVSVFFFFRLFSMLISFELYPDSPSKTKNDRGVTK